MVVVVVVVATAPTAAVEPPVASTTVELVVEALERRARPEVQGAGPEQLIQVVVERALHIMPSKAVTAAQEL